MEQPHYSTQSLNHLGLLSSLIKKVKLSSRIDKMLPLSQAKGAKVTMGERAIAMVFNALGFVDSRLYMFTEFLADKPVNRIIGESVN